MAPSNKRGTETPSASDTPKPKKKATEGKATETRASDTPKPRKKVTELKSYKKGDKVLCKYGDYFYPAKIISTESDPEEGYFYEVKYDGWGDRYNEAFSQKEAQERFTEHTTESAKKAKEQVRKAAQQEKSGTKAAISVSAKKADTSKTSTSSKTQSKGRKSSATPFRPKTTIKTEDQIKSEEATPSVKSSSKRRQEPAETTFTETQSVSTAKPVDHKLMVKFRSAIFKDSATILVEENEKILKCGKFPKLPAKHSVETIIFEYLETHGISVENLDKQLYEDLNAIVPNERDIDQGMICLLHIFDTSLPGVTLYPVEKEKFEKLSNEDSVFEGPAGAKRFSKTVGITYLLRFISQLYDLFNSSIWHSHQVEYYGKIVSEFGLYLNNNLNRFYDADTYYE